MLSNRVVEAHEALELGLADELAAPGEAVAIAGQRALDEAEGAAMPRQFIIDWFARDISEALDYEQSVQPILLNSAEPPKVAPLAEKELRCSGALMPDGSGSRRSGSGSVSGNLVPCAER